MMLVALNARWDAKQQKPFKFANAKKALCDQIWQAVSKEAKCFSATVAQRRVIDRYGADIASLAHAISRHLSFR